MLRRRQVVIKPPEEDESVFATSRIDPQKHKAISSRNFYQRTKYALAGLLFSLRREKSVRNVAKTSGVVMTIAFWLRLDRLQLLVIFLSLGMVWISELLNSAIEAVVDMVTPRKWHDMAKVAKDVAASATFVATMMSALTTLVLVIPPLLRKLGILHEQ